MLLLPAERSVLTGLTLSPSGLRVHASDNPDNSRMNSLRYVIAAVVVLVGLIFVGQGLGFIGGSRMTNDLFWAAVGAVMVIAAIILALMTWRSRPR